MQRMHACATLKKSKSAPSHPPFIEMITEAIVTLKKTTDSSQYAVMKFIEQKHKQYPAIAIAMMHPDPTTDGKRSE